MKATKKKRAAVWFNPAALKMGAATVNMYKRQPPLPQPKSGKK